MFTFCTLIKAQIAERSTQHGVIVREALVNSAGLQSTITLGCRLSHVHVAV